MKIGIDVGGTKTEGILLDPNGTEIDRKRINTEKSYDGTIKEYYPLLIILKINTAKQNLLAWECQEPYQMIQL